MMQIMKTAINQNYARQHKVKISDANYVSHSRRCVVRSLDHMVGISHRNIDWYCMILNALPSNIKYTGRRRAISDDVQAYSYIAFLAPVHSIMDGIEYNISFITHYRNDIIQY